MKPLRPFFSYFGSKWRASTRYPKPKHPTIVEPFAGGAGYSHRYWDREVILCDADERIAALWEYLIGVSPSEIRALPLLPIDGHVDDLGLPEEPSMLIGFNLYKGAADPAKKHNAWSRKMVRSGGFWTKKKREIVARQVEKIKHWRVVHGSYEDLEPIEATWFVDPPYQGDDLGRFYRHSSVDYQALGQWCRSRPGQVIVCEAEGADWLPFQTLGHLGSARHKNTVDVFWGKG